MAEPSRRKLIGVLLLKGEATASRLADDVPFSRQAVSKHLAVLAATAGQNASKNHQQHRIIRVNSWLDTS